MKIVLIIYSVSWLILLAAYISDRISKKGKSSYKKDNSPWYLYALMIALAPLAAILTPYFLIETYVNNKKEKKRKKLREEKERAIKEKIAALELKFKHATKLTGDYITVARKLHDMVNHRNYDVLSCLNKISLPEGYKLVIEECQQSGIGAKSKIYIQFPNGEKDEDIFAHLLVEQSDMGAWQAYLLHELWHALPLFWHANYDARDYIFCSEDSKQISSLKEQDVPRIIEEIASLDFTPEVRVYDGIYFVSACYWTDFGGLIRENIAVQFNRAKVENFELFNSITKYEYDCNIYF